MASIGMRYVVAAPITTETSGGITYGTKQTLKAVEASLSWELDDSKMYADDAVAETDGSITGYTLDTTVDDLTDAQEAALCGYTKASSGDEYTIYDDPAPYSGIGYIRVLKKNGVRHYKAVFYPRIQLTRNSESDKTREGSTSWQGAQLHGVGLAQYLSETGKNKFRTHQTFDKIASAISYLDGKFT